jgi:hypothetical protein
MLRRFDPQHLPADFRPYTAAEVGHLRKNPMSDPLTQRAALMADSNRRLPPDVPVASGDRARF